MEIRPFDPNPEEYEAVLELRNLVDPDEPSTVAIWQHWDALRGADSLFERWVVADEYGRFQAYAQFDETHPNSKKFEFNLLCYL